MKIRIKREVPPLTVECEPLGYYWEEIDVTPEELITLINRGETLTVSQDSNN